MDNIEKEVLKYIEMDEFETCLHCSFYPGGGSWLCFAPWTDLGMEERGINPCQEGVYLYLSGNPGPHLKELLKSSRCDVWIREKGEFAAKDPDKRTEALRQKMKEMEDGNDRQKESAG